MFGKMGELKKMYDKYKKLQKELKNLVIRRKEGEFNNPNGENIGQIVVEINGEMKLVNIQINDTNLLNPEKKEKLENLIKTAFTKAQEKAQQIVAEKTKEILGVDPSMLEGMLGKGSLPF